MKKRLFIVVLTLVMVMAVGVVFTGCGESGGSDAAEENTTEDAAEKTAGEEAEGTPEDSAEEAQAENYASQLEIISEEVYSETSPSIDSEKPAMMIAVKNNSDKTLDLEYSCEGTDKSGEIIYCYTWGDEAEKAVGPGETRWFRAAIGAENIDDIDSMNTDGDITERFKATESAETSFSDKVELGSGLKAVDGGITDITATNNSDLTGPINCFILYKKDGKPVYFANTALCNIVDGEIAFLEPGQSTNDPTFITDGGNDYDDFEVFVTARTGSYE